MSAFVHYKSSITEGAKILAKQAKHKHEDPAEFYCRQMLRMDPGGEAVGTKVMFEDLIWRAKGRRTIFVDSKELPQQVARIKLKGEIGPVLAGWQDHFSLAFPASTRVDGLEMPGLLVSYQRAADRRRMREQVIRKLLGADVYVDTKEVETLFISYNRGAYLYCLVTPLDRIQDTIQGRIDWLRENEFAAPDNPFNMKTTEEDHRIQSIMLKTVCGLLLYAEAYPGVLHDGLPDGYGTHELGKAAHDSKRLATLSGPSRHGPTEPFFRIGHWRTLNSQRFRHDEQGRARVIPVKASIVGGRVLAQTLEEAEHRT